MKKVKFVIAGTLVSGLLFCGVGAEFDTVNRYNGNFSDISEADWFCKDVEGAYELGFMNGTGENLFTPNGNVTVAEAVTMASRVHAAYNEKIIPDASGNWYDKYVKYAVSEDIMEENCFADFEANATRYETAKLFKNALPENYYTEINSVDYIPDISPNAEYYSDVLALYKAGVVMGSDIYGNFRPYDDITRAEAAAILNRVAIPEKRLKKELVPISFDEAYELEHTRSFLYTTYDFQTSGWTWDNRGELPSLDADIPSGELRDISEKYPTALIRHYNKIDTGRLVLDAYVMFIDNMDGAFFEFRNENDKSIYRMQAIDGKWCIANKDGTYAEMTDVALGRFNLRFVIDLDKKEGTAYINFNSIGTYPLTADGEELNILNFRMATTEESTAAFSVNNLDTQVNYSVFENFIYGGNVPYAWVGNEGLMRSNSELHLAPEGNGYLSFVPTSGKVIAESEIWLDNASDLYYTLLSGTKEIVKFHADGKNMLVNGKNVYPDYHNGLWYRLRFELDTENMKVLVKVNGREIDTVDFANKSTSIDGISVINNGAAEAAYDNFKVFRTFEYDDYVPVPVKPDGEEDYTVGMIICSIWREGDHKGWKKISAYDKPYMGYYDDGNPEAADWEIKYMVEHGVDFQAFCWFPKLVNGKIKPHDAMEVAALHDGYMNAKYSDMMKYCLLWEVTNSSRPSSTEEWDTVFLPYIVENYFKDDRYMVLDNKLVFSAYGPRALNNDTIWAHIMETLNAEAKKLGFDGILAIACQCSKSEAERMGFDGTYSYGMGRDNWNYEFMQYKTLANALQSTEKADVYYIPSPSIGQNSPAWYGRRFPIFDYDEWKDCIKWMLDEYIPEYSTEDWQKNLIMLGTWNEFGEGTSMNPSENIGGFKYLDVIRELCTDEGADDAVNIVPTEKQQLRIGRMYPQYIRQLKNLKFSDLDGIGDNTNYYVHRKINFEDCTDTTGSGFAGDLVYDERGLSGVSSNNDTYLFISPYFPINLDDIAGFRITAEIPFGEELQLFYKLNGQANWSGSQVISVFSTSDDLTEYTVLFKDHPNSVLEGMLTGIRIDPVTAPDLAFTLQSLEFLSEKPASEYPVISEIDLKNTSTYGTGVAEMKYTDESISGISTNNDPILFINGFETVDLADVYAIEVTAAVPKGGKIQMFWKRPGDDGWSYDRVATADSVTDKVHTYLLYADKKALSGTMANIRLDVGDEADGAFELRSIRFLGKMHYEADTATKLYINGRDTGITAKGKSETGDTLFPYDPDKVIDRHFSAYETYDYEKKALTLEAYGHTVTFTFGLDYYIVDGEKVKLGYTIETDKDGLPFIPFEKLSAALGCTYEEKDGVAYITTEWNDFIAAVEAEKNATDAFEFNIPGYVAGWSSYNTSINVGNNGYLSGESTQSTDPVMMKTLTTKLDAKKYNYIDVRIRYDYVQNGDTNKIQMFFQTSSDGAWSEGKSQGHKLTEISTNGEFVTYRFDMSVKTTWKDYITALRFDPFNAVGTFDIDYIRFGYDSTKTQAVEEEKVFLNSTNFETETEYGTLILGYDFSTMPNATGYFGTLSPDYKWLESSYNLYTQSSYENDTTLRSGNYTARGVENQAIWLQNTSASDKVHVLLSPLDPSKTDWAKKGIYTLEFDFKGKGAYAEFRCAGDGGTYKSPVTEGKENEWTTARVTFKLDGSSRTHINYIYMFASEGNTKIYFDNIKLYVSYDVTDSEGSSDSTSSGNVTEQEAVSTKWEDSEEYGKLLIGLGFDKYGDVSGKFPTIKPDYMTSDMEYPLYSDDRYENYTILRSNSYNSKGIADNAIYLESSNASLVPSVMLSPDFPSDSTKSDWSKKGIYTIQFDFKGESAYAYMKTDGIKELVESAVIMGDVNEWKTITAEFEVDGTNVNYIKYIYFSSGTGKTKIFFDNFKVYYREK